MYGTMIIKKYIATCCNLFMKNIVIFPNVSHLSTHVCIGIHLPYVVNHTCVECSNASTV